MKVVFDTNTVVSALLFEHGRLSWLRPHWQREDVIALVSKATIEELIRVLTYPKFALERADIEALLSDYIPFTNPVEVTSLPDTPRCKDPDDQMFIDLAIQAKADVLVSGDHALLQMDIGIVIESAVEYGKRVMAAE